MAFFSLSWVDTVHVGRARSQPEGDMRLIKSYAMEVHHIACK